MFELSSGVPYKESPLSELLSPEAYNDVLRAEIAREYQMQLTVINQTEMAAFGLAVQALVRHGRPMYFRGILGHAELDPLSTGFRMIDEPVDIFRRGDPGVVVRAIRLGLSFCTSEQRRSIPYKAIRRARQGKADPEVVARQLADVITGVDFRGYALTTRREDITHGPLSGAWCDLVREAPAQTSWLGESIKRSTGLSDYQYAKQVLRTRPSLAMWAVPLPDLDRCGQHGGSVSLMKNNQYKLSPYTDAADFARLAGEELHDAAGRAPARMLAMEWMHAAEQYNRTVSSLGGVAVQPHPASRSAAF